jgi:hypothetical protein
MPVLRARSTAAETASSYAALNDLFQPLLDGLNALAEPQRRALSVALLLEDAHGPVDPRLVARACLSLLAAARSAAARDRRLAVARRCHFLGVLVHPPAARGGWNEGDRHRPQRRGGRRPGDAPPRAAGRSRAGARGRATGCPRARRSRPRPDGGVVDAARARAPARGVRGQPADGARADPRTWGRHRNGRAAAARPLPPPRRGPTRRSPGRWRPRPARRRPAAPRWPPPSWRSVPRG